MSKGKKWKTPKRYHKKICRPRDRTYFRQSNLNYYAHSYRIGSGHNGRWHKWYFRQRKFFKSYEGGRMSMRKPMAIEIWYWD